MKAKVTSLWAGLPQGAMVMVDTAPFIYVLESHPQFSDQFLGLFEAAAKGDLTIALSTITLAEVLTGPFKAGQTALAKRYEKSLSYYKVIPVSTPIAALAAQLRAQYRLKLPDAIQLATALDIGATAFVTHDRDFSQVTGVEILMGDPGAAS
jgi:predicted nucleic acid-binding protein